MLPYFAPPYRLHTALRAAVGSRRSLNSAQIESLFADGLGIQNAIVLPSARAGIKWGLQAFGAAGTRVACPVFTCSAVWEAVFRAGAEIDGVDLGENSFLMDGESLSHRATGRHALVLSEIYGHTYDLKAMRRSPGIQPDLRIVDLAGGVLGPELLSRLDRNDLAVISFGRGSKSMYCGWGGMAFTADADLSREVRHLRDSEVHPLSSRVCSSRALRLLGVSMLRTSAGCAIKRRLQRAFRASKTPITENSPDSGGQHPISAEFWSPSTRMERLLMARNLIDLREHTHRRKELVRRYNRNLKDLESLVLPPDTGDVLSHYTIRVPAEMRNGLVHSLDQAGIETGRLFFFSPQMWEYRTFVEPSRYCQDEYPNAVRTASEVINLPLHPRLKATDVDMISEKVRNLVATPATRSLRGRWPQSTSGARPSVNT